jgi:hypothetical protein
MGRHGHRSLQVHDHIPRNHRAEWEALHLGAADPRKRIELLLRLTPSAVIAMLTLAPNVMTARTMAVQFAPAAQPTLEGLAILSGSMCKS